MIRPANSFMFEGEISARQASSEPAAKAGLQRRKNCTCGFLNRRAGISAKCGFSWPCDWGNSITPLADR